MGLALHSAGRDVIMGVKTREVISDVVSGLTMEAKHGIRN